MPITAAQPLIARLASCTRAAAWALAPAATACSTGVDPQVLQAEAQAARARRGDWVVTAVDGQALAAGTRATLRLGVDGRIGGQAGCNTYLGSYTLEGGRFSLGQLVTDALVDRPAGGAATTRPLCAPAQRADEQRLLGVLERANTLAWRDGEWLTLRTPDGRSIVARRP